MRDVCTAPLTPTPNRMNLRGSQLLEAHIRSFDLDEPTVRERLEAVMGESLARKLVFALALHLASSAAKPGTNDRPVGRRHREAA